jgi:hypothetical protein
LLALRAEELTAPLFVRALWHGPSQADQIGTLEVRVVQPGPFPVRTGRHVLALQSPADIAGMVREVAKPGDYVVFLGAGTITNWAYALPGELAAMDGAGR